MWSQTVTADSLTVNASHAVFENMTLGSGTLFPSFTITQQNANVTLNQLMESGTSTLNVSTSSSGNSTTIMYSATMPGTVYLDGLVKSYGDGWNYSSTTHLLTLAVVLSANSKVWTLSYPPSWHVTFTNDGHGSTSLDGYQEFLDGTNISLSAVPDVRYVFLNWVISPLGNFTDNPLPLTINATLDGLTVTAYFYFVTALGSQQVSTSNHFQFMLVPGSSMMFQTDMTEGLVLHAVSSQMEGTNCALNFNSTTGTFSFINMISGLIQIAYTSTFENVTWDGVTIATGTTESLVASTNYLLEWGYPTIPGINGTTPTVTGNLTYYFRDDVHTVNTVVGYNVQTTEGTVIASAAQNLGTAGTDVEYGFTANLVNSRGAATSLMGSTPVAVLARSGAGEGYQSATVDISSYPMNLGLESISITLYTRLDGLTWLPIAQFTTDTLMYKGLVASTWNFTLYTKVAIELGDTVAYAYWGESTRMSGVSGLVFINPLAQEIAIWKLQHGDWFGGILYPYMLYGGTAVYGLGFLFVGGVLYLRHKKWEVILVCLLLFGGTGGIGLLIPNVAYRLLYMFVAFALTWLLLKVFK